ncbi:MAG: peptidoglycan-associated lipoprotein Pal [Gammaproteobacteria bacterium]|jgi:peptidoglycan-associated lipoprotein
MIHGNKVLLLGVFALMLSACASTTKQGGTAAQQGQAQSGQQQATGAAQQQGGFQGSPFDNPDNPLSKTTVYFNFDSSEILPDDRPIVIAHAKYLVTHPNVKVVLQGNTDERGTAEYNIALGERRAKAVSQLMQLQGVAQSQIQVVSFGKEHPVALGHNEAAWSKNRRVDIVYPNGH